MNADTDTVEVDEEVYVRREAFYRMFGKMEDTIDELTERVEELEAENKKLRADLRSNKNTWGSKKTKAKRIAANKIIAEAEKNSTAGLRGAGVTATEMMTAAEGLGTSFSHSTVYRAWEALAEDWSFLQVNEGDGTKHGKPKMLVADADKIPTSFRDVYHEQ